MIVREQSELVERPNADTSAKVNEALKLMREIVRDDPAHVWTARELQERAGEGKNWSSSVKSLAFWLLVESGDVFIRDDDLAVRLSA